MISFDKYIIRGLDQSDLEPYFEMVDRNRSRLEDFFIGTTSRTQDLEAAAAFLADMEQKRTDKLYFPYIMIERETNRFVAFFDLKNVDWSIPKTEIGYYVDKDFAGKGLSTKATDTFTNYAFDTFRFKKILLRTHQSNKAAQAIAEKCGYVKEGVITMDYKTTSGEIIDLIYYGKLRQ